MSMGTTGTGCSPDCATGQEDDAFESGIEEEVVEAPETPLLPEWIRIQVRIIAVGERRGVTE